MSCRPQHTLRMPSPTGTPNAHTGTRHSSACLWHLHHYTMSLQPPHTLLLCTSQNYPYFPALPHCPTCWSQGRKKREGSLETLAVIAAKVTEGVIAEQEPRGTQYNKYNPLHICVACRSLDISDLYHWPTS